MTLKDFCLQHGIKSAELRYSEKKTYKTAPDTPIKWVLLSSSFNETVDEKTRTRDVLILSAPLAKECQTSADVAAKAQIRLPEGEYGHSLQRQQGGVVVDSITFE